MDGSKAREVLATLHRLPVIQRRPSGAVAPVAALTFGWSLVLGLGWPLVMALSVAIEPAPSDPEATVPLVVQAGGMVLLLAMAATAVAAAMRRPAAIGLSAVAGIVSLAFVVSCPGSGHHSLAAWWFGELALTAGMLGVTAAAYGRTRRRSSP